jgi:hypothetical protein
VTITGKILGRFTERLERRIAALNKADRVAARIEAPPELRWWYWTEFGTAAVGDKDRASGNYYEIDPVDAEVLRFPYGGEMVLRDHVDHPGIRPHRSITKALPQIREVTQSRIHQALQAGAADAPKKLQEAVFDALNAPGGAKDLIVQSMAVNIPGHREVEPERGRLGGASAAEAFEAMAKVVNLSGEA